MSIPKNYTDLCSHIRAKLYSGECIKNRELLIAIKKLTYLFEDNQSKRPLFQTPIDYIIVNELCVKIHNVLGYLDENYDKDLDQITIEEHLSNVKRIKSIRDEYFQGENWNSITIVLQCVSLSLIIPSLIMVFTTPTFGLGIVGLFTLGLLLGGGAMISEKQGFNYSVASKLTFFNSDELSIGGDSFVTTPSLALNQLPC